MTHLSLLKNLFLRSQMRAKRFFIQKLGLVSDQFFFLDSHMVSSHEKGVERLGIHSPSAEIECIVPARNSSVRISFLPRYTYKITDSIIDPLSGFIYDQAGTFIAESSAWNPLRALYSWPKPFIHTRHKTLPGEYIYIHDCGYGHWLLEDLPAFLGAFKLKPEAGIICPINPSPWLKYFLDSLPASSSICYIDSPISPECLIMAGKAAGQGHPSQGLSYNPKDIELLREYFHDYLDLSKKPSLKLFVSRNGLSRCPENILEIEEMMYAKGYKIINTGLVLSEQITLFSSAKKVIGLHGGALTNLVWCAKETNVVELFPREYMPTAFPSISSTRALNYSWMCYGDLENSPIDLLKLESLV